MQHFFRFAKAIAVKMAKILARNGRRGITAVSRKHLRRNTGNTLLETDSTSLQQFRSSDNQGVSAENPLPCFFFYWGWFAAPVEQNSTDQQENGSPADWCFPYEAAGGAAARPGTAAALHRGLAAVNVEQAELCSGCGPSGDKTICNSKSISKTHRGAMEGSAMGHYVS